MAFGLGGGTMGGLAGAAGQAAGAGQGGGPKGGSNQGGKGGGRNENSVPVQPKPAPRLKPIPGVPDSDGGAIEQDPVDLSLIAGPQDLPQRRPLINASVSVPATGVTGYAGQR
jgi:hypothetical protein